MQRWDTTIRGSLPELLEKLEIGWCIRAARPGEALRTFEDRGMKTLRAGEEDGTATVVRSGHAELGDGFAVTARFCREADGRVAADLEWTAPENGWVIEEVVFPRVTLPYGEAGDFITGFWDMGWRRRGELRFRAGERERIPCESMQFSALLDPTGSFYFDHRDPEWRTKALDVCCSAGGDRLTLGAVFYPALGEHGSNVEFRIPYASTFSFFQGGWYRAARIYREWTPALKSSPRNNPLRKIDLWIWNRGSIAEALPPVKALAAECGDELKLALTWYWWHSNPYDTDYPDFWPPRDGEEEFRKAVAELRRLGIHCQVYVNGLCWDMDGASYPEGGEESAVVFRGGETKAFAFNRFNLHRLAYMCGEAPKFQARLERVVGKLREAGLSGQYLDMIGSGTGSLCRNPRHRHEKHGGSYNARLFRNFLRHLSNPDGGFPLTTECANEVYMEETDGAVVCSAVSAEHIGFPRETLPLFAAVHHGRYALYGNYASPDGVPPWDPLWPAEARRKQERPWHRLYPDQFFFELARTIAWGVQPMVCNLRMSLWQDPEFADARRFLIECARFYRDHREFLFDGEMLDPEEFRCREREVVFLVRMIFTREGEEKELRRTFPAVLHSRWRSPAGETMLVLVNYSASEETWSFRGSSGVIAPHSCQGIPERNLHFHPQPSMLIKER